MAAAQVIGAGPGNPLAGEIYPGITTFEVQTSTAWMNLMENRLAGLVLPDCLGGAPAPGLAPDPAEPEVVQTGFVDADGYEFPPPRVVFPARRQLGWNLWSQGYGIGGTLGSNGTAGGLGYGVGGTLLGIDRWLDENLLIGGWGGFAYSNITDNSVPQAAVVNAYPVGVHLLLRQEGWYLLNIDSYNRSNYGVTRQIGPPGLSVTANGNTFSTQFTHYTELGAALGSEMTQVQPFVGVQYIQLNQRPFTEGGAGPLDLAVYGQFPNSLRSSVGARLATQRQWGNTILIPSATARYLHEFQGATNFITSSFVGAPNVVFATQGNSPGTNLGWFSLGATILLGERTSLYGGYDLQVAERYIAHMGSGTLQYRW
jgi:outer membrane autotransporter protein